MDEGAESERATDAERRAFVQKHTAPLPVPFVPELTLLTVVELTPLWHATELWLGEQGLAIPFWCVAWAGGQALARWIVDHPEAIRGKDVVDFGAGSGLVGIAAARSGAARVRVVDVDPFAWAACALNAEQNGVALEIVRADKDADLDTSLAADVVLAGDVWYERAAGIQFLAWMTRLSARGVRVISGDPGRSYAPLPSKTTRELAVYDVPTSYDLESAPARRTRVFEVVVASDARRPF